jgi:chromosome segregation ATPase
MNISIHKQELSDEEKMKLISFFNTSRSKEITAQIEKLNAIEEQIALLNPELTELKRKKKAEVKELGEVTVELKEITGQLAREKSTLESLKKEVTIAQGKSKTTEVAFNRDKQERESCLAGINTAIQTAEALYKHTIDERSAELKEIIDSLSKKNVFTGTNPARRTPQSSG